jgi:hypothetical protein
MEARQAPVFSECRGIKSIVLARGISLSFAVTVEGCPQSAVAFCTTSDNTRNPG